MQYAALSKEGKREYNEDYIKCFVSDTEACFVLADGLGGHGKGEMASRCVADSIIEDFTVCNIDFSLESAIAGAQKKLLQLQKENGCREGMKTTVVALILSKDLLQWAHIGDSRLYLWKNRRLIGRTLDHSVPQMLVLAKEIKEKEIRFHEDRNRILKAMGIENDSLKPELSKVMKRKKGYAFLLCSDGFWEYINEEEMRKEYKLSKTPKEWLDRMEKIIVRNGKDDDMDNYSAIAVWEE